MALPATWAPGFDSVRAEVRGGAAGSVEATGTGAVWAVVSSTSLEGVGVFGDSMSVMIWVSSFGARGKMGERGPSLVPGLRPPQASVVSCEL